LEELIELLPEQENILKRLEESEITKKDLEGFMKEIMEEGNK
jgi:hypothetical protein